MSKSFRPPDPLTAFMELAVGMPYGIGAQDKQRPGDSTQLLALPDSSCFGRPVELLVQTTQ